MTTENTNTFSQTATKAPEKEFLMPVPREQNRFSKGELFRKTRDTFTEILQGIPSDRISDTYLAVYSNKFSVKTISFSDLFLAKLENKRKNPYNSNPEIEGFPVNIFPKPLVLEVRTKSILEESLNDICSLLSTEYEKLSLVFKPEVAEIVKEKFYLFMESLQVLENSSRLDNFQYLPNFKLSSYAIQSDDRCTFCLIRLNFEGLSSMTFAIGLERKQGVFVISTPNEN